jgi:hypothetical protein
VKNALDERLSNLTTYARKLFERPDIDKKLASYKADVANCCATARKRATVKREEAASADRGLLLDELLTTANETAVIERRIADAIAEKEEAVETALANAEAQPSKTKTRHTRVRSKPFRSCFIETIYDQ